MNIDAFNFMLNDRLGITNVSPVILDFISGGGSGTVSGHGPSGSVGNASSGLFDGQVYLSIEKDIGFSESDWVMFFAFEKSGTKDSILFSNYGGEAIKSGFVFGVNSANKPFVETYNENGPAIYEANIELSSRNSIALSKNGNTITFDYFDFNSKQMASEGFFVSPTSFLPSYSWYLGGAHNSPSYFSGNNFKGNLDTFIYLTGNYFPYEIDTLFSGFTLSKAPNYYYTILDESCYYDYFGLTGSISGITFNPINTLSYLVQTGYLVNKTGELLANITGNIFSGSGIASGNITGYVDSGSGVVTTTISNFSGITGVEVIVNGLRVFQNPIITGTSGNFFLFPTAFTGTPLVFSELYLQSGFLAYQTSGISTSGFFVNYSDTASTSGTMTTMAVMPQDNPSFKVGRAQINQNISTKFVSFPSAFTGTPKVFCKLENNKEQITLGYHISNTTRSGFTVDFSNYTLSPNYYINYIASDLATGSGLLINQYNLNSGSADIALGFSPSFAVPPLIFGEMMNLSGESILLDNITGITPTGFRLNLSNTGTSNNYLFNTLSWSGAQNLTQQISQNVSGLMYIGQITDEAQNIYNLSGYGVSTQIIGYDVPLTRDMFFSGSTTGTVTGISIIPVYINIPVNYTVSLLSGQQADFIHTVYYNNQGSNFITANHTLYYHNTGVQPAPFYIYKNCSQYMGLKLEDYTFNSGYIFTFGMDGVAYTGNITNSDFSVLTTFPYSNDKTNINKVGRIDRSKGYYLLDKSYALQDINLYENGIALYGSGFGISGDIYNQQVFLSGDFALTGSYVIPPDNPADTDYIVYDNIYNYRDYFSVPHGYDSIGIDKYLPFIDFTKRDLYLNGVKLSSGIDYFTNLVEGKLLTRMNGNITDISGEIFSLPFDTDLQLHYTGNFNSFLTNKFAKGTSMLWANGVRQTLNGDYIEIGSNSLLTGQRSFIGSSILPIFDNDFNFWE